MSQMDPPADFMSGRSSQSQHRRSQHKRHSKANRQSAPAGFSGSTQLFEDTSEYQQGPSSVPMEQASGGSQGLFPPGPLVNDPMANMAFQYGTSLANTGKDFVDKKIDHFLSVSKLKYYFAVDTNYVLKKLGLLIFPFAHKNWSVKYNKADPVPPRHEINAPDLYVPVMSFVTYVLVCGLVLGTQNRFTPEQLGMTASSALAWLFVEIMVIIITLYVFGIAADVRYLDLLAFCGYKYVGMILCALAGLVLHSLGYYVALGWMSLTIAFFLARTLRLVISPEAASDGVARASKRRLYLLLSISLMQPFFMYILTRHLNQFNTGTLTNLKAN